MPDNKRRPSRRSFLARVIGAGTSFGATALVTGASAQVRTWSATEAACASGFTDRDRGATADPAGNGRGPQGVSDSDSGANADPAGQGRGTGGVTDNDTGASADPVGHGRGTHTGRTDNDSGAEADPAGQGRGTPRVTDTDTGWGADRVGHGRGGEHTRPVPDVTCPPRGNGGGR